MMKKSTPQAGFTLVELSIVLVVIGLIIGGVLSGKQIMLNAQVTNVANAIQAFQAQFQTYVQNYGAMPGDDATAKERFSSAGIPANTTNSNGRLDDDVSFDSTTDNVETRLLWADMRGAGLVKGAGSNQNQPTTPFGGVYGFQNGAFTGTASFTTNVLCLSAVPGDAAGSIDSRLDDGVRNTGSIMASDSTTSAVEGATYDSAKTYVMCSKL